MNTIFETYIADLNNENVETRLNSLKTLMTGIEEGKLPKPVKGGDVNNHIHTSYSFSPYSPTKAIWMAYNAGLTTAGIIDHDSISGAVEFIEAGKIAGMITTIGVECRADFGRTPLKGRRINNTDQDSIAYVTIHGIPHQHIGTVKDFFAPYTKERNIRDRNMVQKLNILLEHTAVRVDFDSDVVPLSKSSEGGSITERHILFALSLKCIEAYGKGQKLVDFLENLFKLNINEKLRKYLLDVSNPYYEYDLLGVLKSELLPRFYINAEKECPDIKDVIALSNKIGAISAYAYLGDVGNSVTGDKKTQKFEDDYLELLFDVIKELGFNAVTYMPSRNTMEQLHRLKSLCDQYGMFQISGEDINTPRQSFICEAMRNSEFDNLIDSTWALIGHERLATEDIDKGLFSERTIRKYPDLKHRITVYKEEGMK